MACAAVGDVLALHELLGEGFAGFELGGVLGWAEDAKAASRELVDESDGEGELGPDDGEVGLLDGDDVDEEVEVAGVDRDVAG